MTNLTLALRSNYQQMFANLPPLVKLGLILGIGMPLSSALLYPTYIHTMQMAWLEWSRLLETPFVVCEIFVICWAVRKGMDLKSILRALPVDAKVAVFILLLAVFTSSILISNQPTRSIPMAYITLVHLLFGLSVFYLSRSNTSAHLNSFLYFLGIGLILLAILTA